MKEKEPIEETYDVQSPPDPQTSEPDEYDNWHPHFF
jgi:hypothetical protein